MPLGETLMFCCLGEGVGTPVQELKLLITSAVGGVVHFMRNSIIVQHILMSFVI